VPKQLPGVNRVADRGVLAHLEDLGEVQWSNPLVGASASWQSIRSRSNVACRPRRLVR
jgi:hypothetical protein